MAAQIVEPPDLGVRMVNWKVGMHRPSSAEAHSVIIGDASSPLIGVFELEIPLLPGVVSAASLALSAGASYELVTNCRFDTEKYAIFFSVLRKSRSDTGWTIQALGDPTTCCMSEKLTHKICVFQTWRLARRSQQPLVLGVMGINLDPHLSQMVGQLDEMQRLLAAEPFNQHDATLAVGDFNIRLLLPTWSATKPARVGTPAGDKGRLELDDTSVERLITLLSSSEGRRELLKQDPLISSTAAVDMPVAVKLRQIWRFNDFNGLDPGFPTYKRQPGGVIAETPASLRATFFSMREKKNAGNDKPDQYYVDLERSGLDGVAGPPRLIQLGWLDRAAWRTPREGSGESARVDVDVSSHTAFAAPSYSDHSPTVTIFKLWSR